MTRRELMSNGFKGFVGGLAVLAFGAKPPVKPPVITATCAPEPNEPLRFQGVCVYTGPDSQQFRRGDVVSFKDGKVVQSFNTSPPNTTVTAAMGFLENSRS